MNTCLQTVYTKVGNRLVSVDSVLEQHAKACEVRLEAKKKKKRKSCTY